MDKFIKLGRFFFAISMAVFGVQQLTSASFVAGRAPVPAWIPGYAFWAYLTGALLIASSVSIAAKKKARLAATLLGLIFFPCVFLLHVPLVAANLQDAGERTRACETLVMCGAALILAGTLPVEWPYFQGWDNARDKAILFGRFFLAVPMIVFGVQHFMLATFIAGLVPSWIPGHLFWAYFTGVAFVAGGVSIAAKQRARFASTLLGLMFLLWFLLLHLPRVAAAPRNGDELTSAFEALAMCGSVLILAGALPKGEPAAMEVGYLRTAKSA